VNEKLGAQLAALNAALNGTAALLLVSGLVAIKARARTAHGWLMGGAFIVSTIFLISYLIRVKVSGAHHYPGAGAWKAIYYAILFSHMALAAVVPPLAIRTLQLALKKRFAEHRRIVRFTLPIWLYVSVTGVLVYVLLYHPPA
jgi:putative membrane protein